jgi:hypothetical protein
VALLGAFLAVLLSHGERVSSDGIDHFVYLHSLWIDHDLDFANDYALLSPRGQSVDPKTPLGRTGNVHPVGPALAWSPLYLAADVLARISGRPPDGQGPYYRNAVAIAGLLYGWLGLVLVYRTLAPRTSRGAALLAALGLGLGTFLVWYIVFAPTMAHAPAFCMAALVLMLWLGPEPWGLRRAAALGAAIGLAALMKWSSALLLVLPLATLAARFGRREAKGKVLKEGLVLLAAAGVAFLPQAVVWKLLYGSFLTVPQGAAFLGRGAAYAGVLFSPWHGLFSWSPLLYLGAIGLGFVIARDPIRGGAILLFLLALVRVNAVVGDWWGGAAFGARRFDTALPFLGLGLAVLFDGLGRFAKVHPGVLPTLVGALFVTWNLAFAWGFRGGAFDYADPVTFEEMGHSVVSVVDRAVGSPFALPGALVEWGLAGVPPRDYEALFAERPHARFAVRMGEDDRLYLFGPWSGPRSISGEIGRIATDLVGVVAPIHRSEAYTLGLRGLAPTGAASLRALVNGRALGTRAFGAPWTDAEWDVPGEALHPGRNLVELRPLGGAIAVAGVWLEPGPLEARP